MALLRVGGLLLDRWIHRRGAQRAPLLPCRSARLLAPCRHHHVRLPSRTFGRLGCFTAHDHIEKPPTSSSRCSFRRISARSRPIRGDLDRRHRRAVHAFRHRRVTPGSSWDCSRRPTRPSASHGLLPQHRPGPSGCPLGRIDASPVRDDRPHGRGVVLMKRGSAGRPGHGGSSAVSAPLGLAP